jgi:hypothetical protein
MYADPKFRPLSVEAVTLLQEGHLADAIKTVRQSEGLRHKDAKARIDAHLAREPLLRVQLDAQRSAARRKFFFWFVAVDLLITAAVIYWLFIRGST